MSEFDPHIALREAERLTAAVHAHSRWYRTYLLFFALGTIALVLWVGLGPTPLAAGVVAPLWTVFVVALSRWARQAPVKEHGFTRRHTIVIGTWVVLYLAVLLPGLVWFAGLAAWWIPGAVVTSLPLVLEAWTVTQR